jgi:hypothetical protein
MNLTGQKPYQKGSKKPKKERINDRGFLDWLKTLVCAKCGRLPPNDPAHYRTSKNSGISTKPMWSAIPLCRLCHLHQHRIGQYNFAVREWWEAQVKKYVELYKIKVDK